MFSCPSFTKEGVEGIIPPSEGPVTGHLSIWLDSMLQTVQLPACIAYLSSGLAHMNWNTFTLWKMISISIKLNYSDLLFALQCLLQNQYIQQQQINKDLFKKNRIKQCRTRYHIQFCLLQRPGIGKRMQCSEQLSFTAFLYLQLLVNCNLIQAEKRELSDGCEIRSSFWSTDIDTIQKGGHHPVHCVTEWLFSACVWTPERRCSTSERVEVTCCSLK